MAALLMLFSKDSNTTAFSAGATMADRNPNAMAILATSCRGMNMRKRKRDGWRSGIGSQPVEGRTGRPAEIRKIIYDLKHAGGRSIGSPGSERSGEGNIGGALGSVGISRNAGKGDD